MWFFCDIAAQPTPQEGQAFFCAQRPQAPSGRPQAQEGSGESVVTTTQLNLRTAPNTETSEIITSVPTSANIRHYANIVAEKATLRRLIRVAQDIENDCFLGHEEVSTILEKTEKNVFNVLQQKSSSEYTPIRNPSRIA